MSGCFFLKHGVWTEQLQYVLITHTATRATVYELSRCISAYINWLPIRIKILFAIAY